MDDLTPEENHKQGQAVYEIGVWCQACEHHIGKFEDEYHKEEFERLIIKSKNLLSGLSDPFYAGAGRHSIINALVKAGLINEAKYFLAEVKDTFIREKILEKKFLKKIHLYLRHKVVARVQLYFTCVIMLVAYIGITHHSSGTPNGAP